MRVTKVLCQLFCVLALTTAFLTQAARAADGSSGCGPGWYIFKEQTIVSSVLRAVTNAVLFPLSTLGMTFGTSNCASHKLVEQRPEALELMTFAYHDLLIQSAQAEGAHLTAFTQALGCDWKVDAEVKAVLQANYPVLFPSDTTAPADVVLHAIEAVGAKPELAAACGLDVG